MRSPFYCPLPRRSALVLPFHPGKSHTILPGPTPGRALRFEAEPRRDGGLRQATLRGARPAVVKTTR